MPYEAVVYSHFSIIKPGTISSFALLYDRVILPLADWAASDNPRAKEMKAHCPAIQELLHNTAPLRRGQYPILRPLCPSDTSLACCTDQFGEAFTNYLKQHEIRWDELCTDERLGDAFGLLHQFIGNTLVAEEPMKRIPVHYSATDVLSNATLSGLSQYLGVEVADFVIPRIFVDPDRLDNVRKLIMEDHHRQDFVAAMLEFGKNCQDEVAKATNEEEKRDVVRSHAEKLKDQWNKWYRSLSALERMGWLKTSTSGNDSLLTILAAAVSIKLKSKFGVGTPFQAGFEQDEGSIAHDLRGKQLLEIADEKVTWQRHLLAVKLRMDELYGESRNFNPHLSGARASTGPSVVEQPAIGGRLWNAARRFLRYRRSQS